MSVLDEILVTKRDEVARLVDRRAALERAAAAASPPRDFVAVLRRADGMLAVVAELKRRSPSKGILAGDLDPAGRARSYEQGGAAALSVLTDARYFGGSLDDLIAARGATGLPALRKDFVIDALQVYEARGAGADAILLIVAALPDDAALGELHELAGRLGMAAVVEVHTAAELDRALALEPVVVGVNARDLGSFAEDLTTGEKLIERIPRGVRTVAESAIRSGADAARMAAAGFDAVLVGEALVRADDPVALVRELTCQRVVARGAPGATA